MRSSLYLGLLIGFGISLLLTTIGIIAWILVTKVEPSEPKLENATSKKEEIVYVPVNQPTRGERPPLQQIGILTATRDDGVDEPIIIPLNGRPLYNGSQKWEYYAASDKIHPNRVDVTVGGRKCSEDTGCDEVYDGDKVFVPTYNRDFVVSLYKKDSLRYIPVV